MYLIQTELYSLFLSMLLLLYCQQSIMSKIVSNIFWLNKLYHWFQSVIVLCLVSNVLIYFICVCLRIVVSNTYCVVFLLCFSSSCVPYVASFSGLFLLYFSSSCVPYVTSFSGLCLPYFSSSCVPYVTSFSELFSLCFSSSCVPYVASFSELFSLCFSSSCVPYVASFSGLSIFDCISVFSNIYLPVSVEW